MFSVDHGAFAFGEREWFEDLFHHQIGRRVVDTCEFAAS
jgi:hypothetical protein